jgi:hypothetical protein
MNVLKPMMRWTVLQPKKKDDPLAAFNQPCIMYVNREGSPTQQNPRYHKGYSE